MRLSGYLVIVFALLLAGCSSDKTTKTSATARYPTASAGDEKTSAEVPSPETSPTARPKRRHAAKAKKGSGSVQADRSPASAEVPATSEQSSATSASSSPGSGLDDLPPAKAVVSHPDPMLKYHEQTVTVSVSLDMQQNLDQAPTSEMAKAKQQMQNTPLPVKGSPFMRVDIQQTDDFKIRYLGPDDQRIQSVGKDPARWPFGVTPLSSTLSPEDTKTLHVTVTNYASENAKAGRILLQQDETIHVHVRAVDEVTHFIQEHWNWNWLWTTVVIPIWAYLKRRFKRGPQADDGDSERKKAGAA
jgi:hypothetical protein